ncbi:14166_t:CDS:2, partial [Gigaspora rosea]
MLATSTPANNATEEKQAPTLAELVRKYDTKKLIEFLRGEEDLQLDEDDFKILRDEKITGRTFLKTTKEEFRSYGMKGGPATALVDFAKEVKEKKLRAFLSYRSLKEVLLKYGLDIDGVEAIPLFELPRYEIQDNDQHFAHCMADILFRMKHYGSLVLDSLESMRNEYVSTLLHTSLHIAGDLTRKEFSMRPEYEIVGDESSGRVDYGIKESENLICVTEDKKKREWEDDYFDYLYGIVTSAKDWHFLLYSPGEISQASEIPYSIEFNKKALEKNSEEYQALYKGVKK